MHSKTFIQYLLSAFQKKSQNRKLEKGLHSFHSQRAWHTLLIAFLRGFVYTLHGGNKFQKVQNFSFNFTILKILKFSIWVTLNFFPKNLQLINNGC